MPQPLADKQGAFFGSKYSFEKLYLLCKNLPANHCCEPVLGGLCPPSRNCFKAKRLWFDDKLHPLPYPSKRKDSMGKKMPSLWLARFLLYYQHGKTDRLPRLQDYPAATKKIQKNRALTLQ